MAIEIKYNAKVGKWDGIVDGKVVSRCSSKAAVERRLLKEEMEAPVVAKKPKVEFGINERFGFLSSFTNMVARGVANALIVAGPGGLGKTHTVTDALQKMGKQELGIGCIDGDFIIVKGFTTAKALYRILFENNGKIILFDDTDSAFKDPIGSNILKAALDSYDKRVISWNAETDDGLPNRFEFTGRVIFITNLSIEKIPQAVVSRCLRADVTMTLDEKIERIQHVMLEKEFMPQYEDSFKIDVVNFMKKHAADFGDLNIRTAQNALKIRGEFQNGDWERVALYMAVSQ